MNKMRLWYDKPADNWEEALPVGNGRLGGMIFGSIHAEQIQLNEDSVWYGGPMDRNNPDALRHLPVIRDLIYKGRIKEAEKLAGFALTGIPEGQRHYEPLGNLFLFFDEEEGEVSEYVRDLDLESGVASVSYLKNGIRFRRETFSSFPAQAIVIHLTADKPGSLSFHTQLSRGREPWNKDPFSKHKFKYQVGFNAYVDESRAIASDSTMMKGRCGGEGAVTFASVVKVQADGGTVETIGNSVVVTNANTATLFLAASTTFRDEDPLETSIWRVKVIESHSYDRIKQEHIQDYRALFGRVRLLLPDSEELSLYPTNQRLHRIQEGKTDHNLIALYFQYGRYLMIAGSRPGSLPTTLQGIWNQDMLPIWDSKYTININTQMNYWPSESCNLAECHQPLFDLLERMREPGRRTAQVMYGSKGFMAHHNTDIWGDTAPQDVCLSSTIWVLGAAWLSLHLWEHYEYSGDREFLAKSYDTMKEAAEFLVDYMVEDPKGRMVISPTLSPENEYKLPNGETGVLCYGASMDSQIIRALFESCVSAAQILGRDAQWVKEVEQLLRRIPALKVGQYGQIQEWAEDYEEVEPGHRHISQLFALHPGKQITVRDTPALAAAARKTLERRLSHGGGHTGWSRAWIANMWARLEDGNTAYEHVLSLLGHSTLPNLFCSHPPFQIDGNFGGTSAIAEMLLQSHTGEIHLLPALPDAWDRGSVSGLRAKGGIELDFTWENSRISRVVLKSSLDGVIKLRSAEVVKDFIVSKNEVMELDRFLNRI